jgi:hypothetical protein
MGDDNADSAASRLRYLNTYLLEHPVTGPTEGHSPTPNPGTPLRLATVDYVHASVREVAEYTYSANPHAGPMPTRADAVYDWCREHTEHTDKAVQFRRDMLEYRHLLEHAIAAGDTSVVRPHRCPDCHTVGLFWRDDIKKAMCVNRRCAKANGGLHRTHSLARLAFERVALENILAACAT